MNKKILFVVAILLTIIGTGCSKKTKMTCKGEQEFDFETILYTEIKLEFEDDYLKKTETTMSIDFEDESTAKTFAETFNRQEGYTVEMDGNKVVVTDVKENESKIEENKKEKVEQYLT